MAGFKENLITCFLLLTCKQIRNTNRERNNEQIHIYLRACIYLCIICVREWNIKREEISKGRSRNTVSELRKEEKRRNPGDVVLTSARHSPTLTANLVRMTSAGEQEWINSIWHGDEPWPFRMREGGRRDGTHCWVGGWVTQMQEKDGCPWIYVLLSKHTGIDAPRYSMSVFVS